LKTFFHNLCSTLLFLAISASLSAQFATETQKHRLLQLNMLQEGYLLVELPAKPEAPAVGLIDASAQNSKANIAHFWILAMEEHFDFATVYYFTTDDLLKYENDPLRTPLFNAEGQAILLNAQQKQKAYIFCQKNSTYTHLAEKQKIIEKRKERKVKNIALEAKDDNLERYMGTNEKSGKPWVCSKLEPTARKINKKVKYAYALRYTIYVPDSRGAEKNCVLGTKDLNEKLSNTQAELNRNRVSIKDLQQPR